MAVRPAISGFHFQRLGELLGSHDEATLEACSASLRRIADEIAEEEPEEAEEYFPRGRAKSFGVLAFRKVHARSRKLVAENDIPPGHWRKVLVKSHQDTAYRTDSSDWKMNALWMLESDHGAKLSGNAPGLLRFLTRGRPLFGSRIEGSGSYSYLTFAEVNELLDALRGLRRDSPELTGRQYLNGFLDTLVSWLEGVSERHLDLWMVTF